MISLSLSCLFIVRETFYKFNGADDCAAFAFFPSDGVYRVCAAEARFFGRIFLLFET